jgi:hypothetical protein
MYTDNDILFPHHVISTMKDLRGDAWRDLVDRVSSLPETHEETLAFMLMMIRLNKCLKCETDSYRAMRGCTTCAHQTLRRYKGTDEDLLQLYAAALADVREFAAQNEQTSIQTLLI